MNIRYRLFIDFDGTLTSDDVGYELFKKFTNGATEPTVAAYRRGEINSFKCLSRECEIWNQAPPDQRQVFEFLDTRKMAPGLIEFLDRLNETGIEPVILSEGFDFYIKRITEAVGLNYLKIISNKARYSNGRLAPEFPYLKSGCGKCSNCKGYHISRIADPKDSVIFIGDGHSDMHGAEKADIVFAKSFLHNHLNEIRRYHYTFESFFDIREQFDGARSRSLFVPGQNIDLFDLNERHYKNPRFLFEKQIGGNRDVRGKIYLAVEDKNGEFLGYATMMSPGVDGCCEHDIELLPEYRGGDSHREAVEMIVGAAWRRWPDSAIFASISTENESTINLYESLGFSDEQDLPEYTAGLESRREESTPKVVMILKKEKYCIGDPFGI